MKRVLILGVAATAMVSGAHTRGIAQEKLRLQVSPAVSMAPASVMVRVIVEHDAENRQLEIVADSSDFYRRTVIDLDGVQAPKVNEMRFTAIPGGEYEVSAILYDSHRAQTVVRRSITVVSSNKR